MITVALLSKTVLTDRILWHDGQSVFIDQDQAYLVEEQPDGSAILRGLNSIPLEVKKESKEIKADFTIPKSYLEMDVDQYVLRAERLKSVLEEEFPARIERVKHELALFYNRGFYDLLRTMIYIIDTFKKNSMVWGVGRGSSVSSYVLYLLEVHDVDPILYGLEFNEFIKDQ